MSMSIRSAHTCAVLRADRSPRLRCSDALGRCEWIRDMFQLYASLALSALETELEGLELLRSSQFVLINLPPCSRLLVDSAVLK